MLIDDITIEVISGKGGDGRVAFNRNMMSLGPTGGTGGRGGSVYFIGSADIGALNRLRNTKVFRAEDGQDGRAQNNDGTSGQDLCISIPVGTIIHNLTDNVDTEINKVNQQVQVVRGGRGGKGNFHFRGPHNTSPKEFQHGEKGQKLKIRLELRLIADVGLLGLPNAGKSSLLNELTQAKSKVANYPFTTLEPHLGAYNNLIIADIPGIIEGASENRGLGFKFLRHVQRTKVLFHLVSAESGRVVSDYKIIRKELGKFNKELLDKKEYVFLSKADAVSTATAKQRITRLKKVNKHALPLSVYDLDTIEAVKKILDKIDREK